MFGNFGIDVVFVFHRRGFDLVAHSIEVIDGHVSEGAVQFPGENTYSSWALIWKIFIITGIFLLFYLCVV